jgi:hypothetical protein
VEELKDDIFQAECNYFLMHYSKQFKADEWRKYIQLLYPEKDLDMLVFQYYTPGTHMEPSREETFRRMHRFEAHTKKLGIPNPYSYDQHIKADQRWRKLHKNAVPSLLEFMDHKSYVNDTQNIKVPSVVKNTREDDTFDF